MGTRWGGRSSPLRCPHGQEFLWLLSLRVAQLMDHVSRLVLAFPWLLSTLIPPSRHNLQIPGDHRLRGHYSACGGGLPYPQRSCPPRVPCSPGEAFPPHTGQLPGDLNVLPHRAEAPQGWALGVLPARRASHRDGSGRKPVSQTNGGRGAWLGAGGLARVLLWEHPAGLGNGALS